MGLPSPELHVDSSMVKGNVNSYGLSRSGMIVEEFSYLVLLDGWRIQCCTENRAYVSHLSASPATSLRV